MDTAKKSIVCLFLFFGLTVFGGWTLPSKTIDIVRYADSPMYSMYANEYIEYTDRIVAPKNNTVYNAPKYEPIGGLSNACGAVAGSILVGFYDKYFPNMIPNWNSFFSNGKYRGQDQVYVPNVMQELYTLMRTNVDDVGVSETDFLNGLRTYINSKGYSIEYTSVATLSSIDYEACKSTIDSNNLIVIFTCPGDVYSLGITPGRDVITSINIPDYHIMIAYGYEEINYYNESGLFRTDVYFDVLTGRPGVTDALYKISPHNMEAAYAVAIK